MSTPFALVLLLVGCRGPDTTIAKQEQDDDGDGYTSDVDCDDSHITVNPDAPERCDGLDNDCDGTVDEDAEDAPAWYTDGDDDGYGPDTSAVHACEAPPDTVAAGGDCDDAEPLAHPGGVEICDGIDNDCDGTPDNDPTDPRTWYADEDEDGYGTEDESVTACEAPPGYVESDEDCDDDRADVHPDAPEPDCTDPVDHNCDGSTAWADEDGDGFAACEDCDDDDALRHPGAGELCAAGDEDCDGLQGDEDPDLADAGAWYRDVDGDGYAADGAAVVLQCEAPEGYAAVEGDCDDLDLGVNPGATEVCDAADTDEDCDGSTDDADTSTDAATWTTSWADRDGDGYGNAARSVSQCEVPDGYVGNDDDCDDTLAERNPGAAEVCDADDLDEDCDGLADDDDLSATGGSTWYRDGDGDGYAGTRTTTACDAPSGYLATSTDCDDAAASVNPGATEICDAANTDEDCDGLADDADGSATGGTTRYRDADSDSYGDPAVSATSCDSRAGYVDNGLDCDDGDGAVGSYRTWYRDGDRDGYGGSTTSASCSAPSGYVATTGDCDDAAASVNPGAPEVCDAGNTDEDCDGLADDADSSATGGTTRYRDADSDSYGDPTVSATTCDSRAGYVDNGLDCDDDEGGAHPGGVEVCDDGIDQDCSGADEVCPDLRYSGERDLDADAVTTVYGTAEGAAYGYRLAAGDFDGDGTADLLVTARFGTWSATWPAYGTLYGYYSGFGVGAEDAEASADLVYYNTDATYAGYFGTRLDALPDLDGDGADEIWVGRTAFYDGYVYRGGASGAQIASAGGAVYDGHRASGGELDGVGGADLAVGDWTNDSGWSGAVSLFAGLSTSAFAQVQSEASGDQVGYELDVGDVDGDGVDDLWIGAPGRDDAGLNAGAVYLVYGPVSGTYSLVGADAKVKGLAAADAFGSYLTPCGDMDGDGRHDVLVSSARGTWGGAVEPGSVSLLSEVTTGEYTATAASSAVFYGEADLDRLTGGVAAGDVDGDGVGDVLVAAHSSDVTGTDAGSAWLGYGPFSGSYISGADSDASWRGPEASDQLGTAVGILPDQDGDGADELLLAAPLGDAGGTPDRGVLWVLPGT